MIYSAHRLENDYSLMKKYLQKNYKPLQQLVRVKRLHEDRRNFVPSNDTNLEKGCVRLTNLHLNGSLICRDENITNQFKRVKKVGSWNVMCEDPDNCIFLSDLSVVQVRKFVKTSRNKTWSEFLVRENNLKIQFLLLTFTKSKYQPCPTFKHGL